MRLLLPSCACLIQGKRFGLRSAWKAPLALGRLGWGHRTWSSQWEELVHLAEPFSSYWAAGTLMVTPLLLTQLLRQDGKEFYDKWMEVDLWERKGRTMTGSHSFWSPLVCPALPRPLAVAPNSHCPSLLCLSQHLPHKHWLQYDEDGCAALHLPSHHLHHPGDTPSTSLLPWETAGVQGCWPCPLWAF